MWRLGKEHLLKFDGTPLVTVPGDGDVLVIAVIMSNCHLVSPTCVRSQCTGTVVVRRVTAARRGRGMFNSLRASISRPPVFSHLSPFIGEGGSSPRER